MFRQKDYPRQLVIKDALWEVKFVREIPNQGTSQVYSYEGICDPSEKVILIRMGQTAKERLVTFVHECLHAFEEEYRIKLPHSVINKIQYPIAEFIMENCIMPMAVEQKAA